MELCSDRNGDQSEHDATNLYLGEFETSFFVVRFSASVHFFDVLRKWRQELLVRHLPCTLVSCVTVSPLHLRTLPQSS